MIAPPSDLSLEVLTNRVRLTWVDNSGVKAGYRIAVSSYSGMTAYNNAGGSRSRPQMRSTSSRL
ncbi:hypothetical protein DRP53_03555 [candidate division WOR-3 bacterium]|uniref:Fibronectin type III domain-containing protein n=1 Tax=candidate division WOR-3 bacterium TaxID=2052148 RepID=A0A660SJK4_UNCW3|nr:MAG: hypothetical protein DRP53_03555 [candidate division WOR-3 bacterium]